ncbi:unnamed protein product, partial [Ixodes pacificus]
SARAEAGGAPVRRRGRARPALLLQGGLRRPRERVPLLRQQVQRRGPAGARGRRSPGAASAHLPAARAPLGPQTPPPTHTPQLLPTPACRHSPVRVEPWGIRGTCFPSLAPLCP